MENAKRLLRLIERFTPKDSLVMEIKFWQIALVGLICVILSSIPSVWADQSASNERTDAAVGHYAKARALLVEALEEFETARKLARPDLLVDPEEWRISVISRAEELNRILDPQPRITRSGTRFQANNRLVKRISKKEVGELPRDSNTHGEQQRNTETRHSKTITKISHSKAPQAKPKAEAELMGEPEDDAIELNLQNKDKHPRDDNSGEAQASDKKAVDKTANVKPSKDDQASTKKKTEEVNASAAVQTTETKQAAGAGVMEDIRKEDPSVAGMMEKVIEDRLKKLKEEQAKDAAKPKPSGKTVDGLFDQYSDQ